MKLTFAYQEWLYAETFRISRSAKDISPLFLAVLRDGQAYGRGECGVLAQYGQSPDDVRREFEALADDLPDSLTHADIPDLTSSRSVRNALDCALWDLECRRRGADIWALTGVARPDSLEVDLTISVNAAPKMVADAVAASGKGYRILKLKADRDEVVDRVAAIAAAVPGARLIVDANEAWDMATLERVAPRLAELGVELIEQPLRHGEDAGLEGYRGPVTICADESCRDVNDLDVLRRRYQAINIKLDKVGGLTPGLELARGARAAGLGIMVGCSGPTSLGAAPAYVVGALADYLDLDGPALLLDDRADAMTYSGGRLHAMSARLWGGASR